MLAVPTSVLNEMYLPHVFLFVLQSAQRRIRAMVQTVAPPAQSGGRPPRGGGGGSHRGNNDQQ